MTKQFHWFGSRAASIARAATLSACLLLLTALPASAQSTYPEDGWWWDPAAPGRGFLLERQQNTIFIAAFHYTDLGDPEWLTLAGTYEPDSGSGDSIGSMVADVYLNTGGQCIGCEYTAPVETVSQQDPAVIVFHDNRSATLAWSDETIDLERFFWAWADDLDRLEGAWILVTVPASGDPAARMATILAAQNGASVVDPDGGQFGSIAVVDGSLQLSLSSEAEPVTILVPESKRFYARSMQGGLAVLGLRVDDLPVEIPEEVAAVIDLKDLILSNTSADCADYANSYTADVLDEQRSLPFTESVVITAGSNSCTLSSNSIPNHDFNDLTASFATPVAEIDRAFTLVRNPSLASSPSALAQNSYDAVMLNGVVLDLLSAGCYRPNDARADHNGNVPIGCNVNDEWLLDPLGYDDHFGVDMHNAHTQPDGTYHYHGDPEALFEDDAASGASPVIGFAADGFPIYGSYFFDGTTNTIRKARSGWTLKAGSRDSVNGPGGAYNGWYIDDYEFTDSGDLDQCNGMTVNGQYGYYVTDSYPWVVGCLSGTPHASFRK